MDIHYFNEKVNFQLSNENDTSEWVAQIIHNHNKVIEEINYIFCSDDYLLEINEQHLNHDYYTDIITFDNSEEENQIASDIFISIDRIRENASSQSVSFENELHRVMIHGILHLLGFGDKTPSEKKVMREKEDACLSLLKI